MRSVLWSRHVERRELLLGASRDQTQVTVVFVNVPPHERAATLLDLDEFPQPADRVIDLGVVDDKLGIGAF